MRPEPVDIVEIRQRIDKVEKTVDTALKMAAAADPRAYEVREIQQINARLDAIEQTVNVALRLIEERAIARISRLEQIIEPLRLTAEDVANAVELRVRNTDGRWGPIAAADVANAVLAGRRVVKMVPQVVS